jgi:protein-tyrosine phosphatase
MFPLFKKKQAPPADYSFLNADMHSHLIPGIDDGSPDMDTSIGLITGMMQLGYHSIITTPHVMSGMYQNGREKILQGCEAVKLELKRRNIVVDFRAAAEYLLDDYFDSLLQGNEALLTIKDNLVLVEFSFVSPPIDYKQKLFALQIKGYRPILAHPERYIYFHHQPSIYGDLKNAGCLFQVNLLSLMGYYGKNVAKIAARLLKDKSVDLLGTDLHHYKHLQLLRDPSLARKARELLGNRTLLNQQL